MSVSNVAIKIPQRIRRSPTCILKALSSTVKFLPKEPEPTLLDDPYLLPAKPGDRRVYILSKLSGVKTAQFLLNKHPELFYRDDAEPKVEAFVPKEEYSSDLVFTIDDLLWCIDNKDPRNGVIAYKSLEESGVEIEENVLLDFFELICYTNEENFHDFEERERLKFMSNSHKNLVNCTWKNTGLASKIFNRLKSSNDPPRVYSTMISGLVRFNEHRQARQVFDDFCYSHPEQGLFTEAYNSLLQSVPHQCSSSETALQAIDELTKHMEQNGVVPDLKIFNSILFAYRAFNVDESTCISALKLVNDMYDLGIRPSLATYSSLITIICRHKRGRPYGHLVKDILKDLRSIQLDIRDSRDVEFFSNSMFHIANILNNVSLANSLYEIYLDHSNFFPNSQLKSRFLNNYFKLLVTADTLENSMDLYEANVPHNFVPDVDAYEALAEALDLFGASEDVIKKIGQDIVNAKLTQSIRNDEIFRRDQDYVDAAATATTATTTTRVSS